MILFAKGVPIRRFVSGGAIPGASFGIFFCGDTRAEGVFVFYGLRKSVWAFYFDKYYIS
jgi:hypothetical protein